jgi:hypothetical protein
MSKVTPEAGRGEEAAKWCVSVHIGLVGIGAVSQQDVDTGPQFGTPSVIWVKAVAYQTGADLAFCEERLWFPCGVVELGMEGAIGIAVCQDCGKR